MARELEGIEERAQAAGWSFRRTLRQLMETEAAERGQRRLLRLLKDSELPEGKTLAALEESRLSAATRRQLVELCEGHFAERAVNVLAFGLLGRGKTQAAGLSPCGWTQNLPRVRQGSPHGRSHRTEFRSAVAVSLQCYLDTRRALGRRYELEEWILRHWDDFLHRHASKAYSLSSGIFQRWAKSMPHVTLSN